MQEFSVPVRKRLDHDFFNMLTLMSVEAEGSRSEKESTDRDGDDHDGILKIDATCRNAGIRYPADTGLLEDGGRLTDRLPDKFCGRFRIRKPQTHRVEARKVFLVSARKKRKGRKPADKTGLTGLRCL